MTKSHLGIQTFLPSAIFRLQGYKREKSPKENPGNEVSNHWTHFGGKSYSIGNPRYSAGKVQLCFRTEECSNKLFRHGQKKKIISSCITFGGFKEETPLQVRLSNTCICINRQLYCSGAQKRIPRVVTIKNLWTKSHVIAQCGSLSHKKPFHKTSAKSSFILWL